MVIRLEDWNREANYDRLGLDEEYIEFLGNKVVCYSIPIRPGRNLAVIVESAAINYRAKKMGSCMRYGNRIYHRKLETGLCRH